MFQIETISAKMLDYYVERSDAIIIDLRDLASYRKGHVRNAINIPYSELEEYLEEKTGSEVSVPRDKRLFFTVTVEEPACRQPGIWQDKAAVPDP